VVLDGAGGCDVGLHQELLARSELYRLLWERQFEAQQAEGLHVCRVVT